MSAEPSDLFTYGTLMLPEVFRAVTGTLPPAEDAALEDHARLCVRGLGHPSLAFRPGSTTRGRLYRGLDARAFARLDRYEGADYARREVEALTRHGVRARAVLYALRPGHAQELVDEPWDEARFRREDLASYLREIEALERNDA